MNTQCNRATKIQTNDYGDITITARTRADSPKGWWWLMIRECVILVWVTRKKKKERVLTNYELESINCEFFVSISWPYPLTVTNIRKLLSKQQHDCRLCRICINAILVIIHVRFATASTLPMREVIPKGPSGTGIDTERLRVGSLLPTDRDWCSKHTRKRTIPSFHPCVVLLMTAFLCAFARLRRRLSEALIVTFLCVCST